MSEDYILAKIIISGLIFFIFWLAYMLKNAPDMDEYLGNGDE